MTQVVSNQVSGITPTVWSKMVQIPLYKSLVALEIANTRLEVELGFGKNIQVPRFTDLSAQTYTPGTSLSATNQAWTYDTLTVSAYKHATFYRDDVNFLQNNVDVIAPLAENAAYQLKNAIDKHVFQKITGTTGFTYIGVDAAGIQGGTAHRPVSAGSANIIGIFAGAKKLLLQNNVEQLGDWCAVITPLVASNIDVKTTNVGFNVADATLRNGYAGDFMGFQIYISNNLPSGTCSTLSPTISGGAVSATNCRALYFGRKGMIDLVMQKAPTLEIRKLPDRLGANFITWTVFGDFVMTKNRSRGLNVAMDITTSSGSGG
jgi:hypothetical protein